MKNRSLTKIKGARRSGHGCANFIRCMSSASYHSPDLPIVQSLPGCQEDRRTPETTKEHSGKSQQPAFSSTVIEFGLVIRRRTSCLSLTILRFRRTDDQNKFGAIIASIPFPSPYEPDNELSGFLTKSGAWMSASFSKGYSYARYLHW